MKQVITIKCQMPDTNFQIKIQEVHELGGQLIAISSLSTKPGFAGAAIIDAKDSALVQTHSDHKLPIKHYVLNNTYLVKPRWAFNSADLMPTIKNRNQIAEKLSAATRLDFVPSSPLFDKKSETSNKPKDDTNIKTDGFEKGKRFGME